MLCYTGLINGYFNHIFGDLSDMGPTVTMTVNVVWDITSLSLSNIEYIVQFSSFQSNSIQYIPH